MTKYRFEPSWNESWRWVVVECGDVERRWRAESSGCGEGGVLVGVILRA